MVCTRTHVFAYKITIKTITWIDQHTLIKTYLTTNTSFSTIGDA